jgi:predicted transcriptional regulator
MDDANQFQERLEQLAKMSPEERSYMARQSERARRDGLDRVP